MGKIVAPKHSAEWNEVWEAFSIYYDAKGWLDNDTYKKELKKRIGSDQYPSSYTKKIQIITYYGFIEYKDPKNSQSEKRITELGKRFYEDILEGEKSDMWKTIITTLERTTFGRNNDGAPESDSDVELPAACIRIMIKLDGATLKELTYALYLLNEKGFTFDETVDSIKKERKAGSNFADLVTNEYHKLNDNKPLKILRDWGDFLQFNGKNQYIVNPEVLKKYRKRLETLPIFNTVGKTLTAPLDEQEVLDEREYANNIQNFDPRTIDSDADLSSLNNRVPEPSGGTSTSKRYKTKAIIGATVLKKSHYKCEYSSICSEAHDTFLTKKKVPYLECHHLIPMKAQKDFAVNLDREENVVPLCPTCHAAIHYGTKDVREKILRALFNNRIGKLKNCAGHIEISFEDLLSKYYD